MKQLKPRDKIVQKMSRDGLTEENKTTDATERISARKQEPDFTGIDANPAPQPSAAERTVNGMCAA